MSEPNELEVLFQNKLKKLNKSQRKAVLTIDGPLLVVAGPGSGKTEILSMRVAEILRKTQARPTNILCLTFTDAAAQNMRERLTKLIGDRAYQVSIHTFHNFCVDVIRSHGEFFYHGATFSPADPVTKIALLENIFNNLSHDNPLRSYHPEEGFVYLKAVQSAIEHVKRAGLRPEEILQIIEDNKLAFENVQKHLIPVFEKRLGKDSISEIKSASEKFTDISSKRKRLFDLDIYHPLEEAIALSLAEAIAKAEQEEKNEPLSKWKTKYLKKDDTGKVVWKDELNITKMSSFVEIYKTYQSELYRLGYFDFDDMILDVISALQKEPRLRYELEEQYQYLLVDEFQDTNNAQMRIISQLTSSPNHEGKPNIMVVGDDDQAIYKFQGAELSNILDFQHRYKDVEMVTMTDNYRSTQDILDIAMSVIRKGEKRLENLIPDLSKQLVSKGGVESGNIHYKIFETALHEYKYVADTIKQLISDGHEPNDIAVIARKHGNLEDLVPYMKQAGVPIKYEREQSVFAEPHIREIIVIARYIASIVGAGQHENVRDDLLPQILSFEFWKLSRLDIWKISLKAKKENISWLEAMQLSENTDIKNIANFLIELGVLAKSEPLPKMIDKIVGAHIALSSDDEKDESDDVESDNSTISVSNSIGDGVGEKFISPFRKYYFSKEKFSHARAEYLTFLSSLRVFINALKDFTGADARAGRQKEDYSVLLIEDLVKFVDVYEKNNLKLNDKSPFVTARKAVELLSAHGSKGLEYKTVFILSCQDDIWASKGGGMKLSFPINLPIEPAGDQEDDQLRLFYVALTRARENLYMTSHEVRDNGKEASQLRFLVGTADKYVNSAEVNIADVHELLEASSVSFHTAPFLDTEEVLLKGVLENYKLSITHLNNFLNIPKGGPALFFEQNLLRFPQSKSPSGSYGSAVHTTLEITLHELKEKGKFPETEKILENFESLLKRERMHPQDFKLYLERGKKALSLYIEKRGKDFKSTDIAEMDFGREMICIAGSFNSLKAQKDVELDNRVFITGKIDKVTIDESGNIKVYDYKTGKAFESFEDPEKADEVKAHSYKNQLLFYKLLINESAYAKQVIFSNITGKVESGVIDFIEPVGSTKKIVSLETDLPDEEVERLKKIAIAVYKKIKNLEFDIPKEIAMQEFKSDLEAILAFEEYLLSL